VKIPNKGHTYEYNSTNSKGDIVLFCGNECYIKGSPEMNIGEANRYKGKYENGIFQIGENLSVLEMRFILTQIYIREAKRYIPESVSLYAKQMQLSPDNVKITSAFSQWGSCSDKMRLNFPWMLMMGDDAVIDSIVVHELAHMRQMNHSKYFYAVVYKYYPEYDNQQQKLKQLEKATANFDTLLIFYIEVD
jgi:predicted metal-dependent hydrolase